MAPDSAVNGLLALAALSLLAGLLAVGRVVWRARGFPKTALQFVSLAGGFFCLVAGSALLWIGLRFEDRMRAAVEFHGRPVPELRYRSAAGGPLENSNTWKGTPVLLNVWATWCKPCLAELPLLAGIEKEYAGRLRVVAVSDEEPATVAEFLKTHALGIGTAVVARGAHDPAPFFFNVPVRPISFLIDSQGIVRESRVGAMTEDEMRRMLAPHLP
jgi:thiol-disulfide isomerase/thioredoxin